ncbi:Ig-like domain (group 2) [Eubacterium uniforme]|uniref:Ig-like domain (Group 2) n=2 Tax=Eubacterium uniforme TaxID=39495 RepID=A0A1T4VSU9_9FIRM|nr:Ig-like domain (group 2) [Eubacterium uniforme]
MLVMKCGQFQTKNVKSNAIAVTLDNYKKIVLKKDNAKKFKLKSKGAKVIYSSKVILSKKIRWYCSNKRVLKINNKKGKMKALKKGKCYIWAKAHNGINSKKIKVIIK